MEKHGTLKTKGLLMSGIHNNIQTCTYKFSVTHPSSFPEILEGLKTPKCVMAGSGNPLILWMENTELNDFYTFNL